MNTDIKVTVNNRVLGWWRWVGRYYVVVTGMGSVYSCTVGTPEEAIEYLKRAKEIW